MEKKKQEKQMFLGGILQWQKVTLEQGPEEKEGGSQVDIWGRRFRGNSMCKGPEAGTYL